MTLKLLIPAKVILDLNSKTLDLVSPRRCSRCNATPAPYFETHPLRYRADLIPNRNVAHRYRINTAFRLRLPLCERCYRASFGEDPESYIFDSTSLGRIAKIRSWGIKIAAVIALIGFVLLMNLIPLPSAMASIPFFWLYIILAAVIMLAIIFGLTAWFGQSLQKKTDVPHFSQKYPRSVAYEAIETAKPTPAKTAVFLHIANEDWGRDCATLNHWKYESPDSPSEKEKEE